MGFGTRYALELLETNLRVVAPTSPVYPDLFANIIGCAIMGAMVTHQWSSKKCHAALYLGLTTGLAGSLTTFSAWNGGASLSVFFAHQVVAVFLLELAVSISMSIIAFYFGIHLIHCAEFIISRLWPSLIKDKKSSITNVVGKVKKER